MVLKTGDSIDFTWGNLGTVQEKTKEKETVEDVKFYFHVLVLHFLTERSQLFVNSLAQRVLI